MSKSLDVALLHGFAATSSTWRHVVPALSAHHRVVALDRPWTTIAGQVEATVEAMDAAGMSTAALVAHSAGAEVALGVAVTAPSRVAALVLVAPVVGRGAPRPARWLARTPGAATVGPHVLRFGARHLLGVSFRRMWRDRSTLTDEVLAAYREPLLQPGVAESLWAMTAIDDDRMNLAQRLGEVDQPALVILGNADPWAQPLPLPDVTTLVFEHCGHLPHEEQPNRTARAIVDFLAAHS